MSRKANCPDSAVIEKFFGLLKSEFFYLQNFHSIRHFKQALLDYLDHYNNKRIKQKGLPPAVHRRQALLAAQTIFLSNFLGSLHLFKTWRFSSFERPPNSGRFFIAPLTSENHS
ncbi:MAG: IS3 family transposase [Clostridia bacterium]|nr:IS3 family transposase [Clostridia bacterium]